MGVPRCVTHTILSSSLWHTSRARSITDSKFFADIVEVGGTRDILPFDGADAGPLEGELLLEVFLADVEDLDFVVMMGVVAELQ